MKINIDISSPDSIEKAIEELEGYRNNLMDKVQQFLDAIIAEGIQVAKARLGSTQGDSTDAFVDGFYVTDTKAIIVLEGHDCLFVEFGAGIYYNNGNAHPKAHEFGYGVGTYPSEHPPNRAINPGYWWYKGNNDALHFSLGTEASMPLFNAAENIRNIVLSKAKEIFRS